MSIPAHLLPVRAALDDALALVADRFDGRLDADLPEVASLLARVSAYRGKMLRPSLVLLTAIARGGEPTPAHVTLGAVVEMVHVATLVHDDVLDHAQTRRSAPTIGALAGNERAVVLGDYLFAAAYELCSTLDDQRAALAVARASMTVCSGEVLQLSRRADLDLDLATYTTIVERKTGALLALACDLGVRFAGADEDVCAAMARVGLNLGIAFQIQDDVLDLAGEQATVGKSVRRDLLEGKLTLPVILCLRDAEASERARLRDLLAEAARGDESAADAGAALVRASDAIDRARAHARDLVHHARTMLIATLPETDARELLLLKADAVVARSF